MKKKAYMAPATEITEVRLMQMIAASIAGGDINKEPLDPEDDEDGLQGDSRRGRRSEWDDDDEW